MVLERSPGQRMQDDEDHRLAMCGLSDDPRLDWELEDREYQYHDFRFHPARPPVRWVNGGEPGQGQPLGLVLAASFFASGRRDPAPHDAKRAQDVWEGSGPHQGSHVLSPPPLSKT